MPEWTTEVIWWVAGAGVGGLLIGWIFGRALGGRVPAPAYEVAVDRERTARRDLQSITSARQKAETDLARLRQAHATTEGELDATQRLLSEARLEAEAARARTSEELMGLNASLERELEAARERYGALHTNQSRAADELQAAQNRIVELDEMQRRMTEQLADAHGRIDAFESRTGASSDDLFMARARVSEVEGKLALALTALKSASDDLGTTQQRLVGDRPASGEPRANPSGALPASDTAPPTSATGPLDGNNQIGAAQISAAQTGAAQVGDAGSTSPSPQSLDSIDLRELPPPPPAPQELAEHFAEATEVAPQPE